jgi:hypothetical protein
MSDLEKLFREMEEHKKRFGAVIRYLTDQSFSIRDELGLHQDLSDPVRQGLEEKLAAVDSATGGLLKGDTEEARSWLQQKRGMLSLQPKSLEDVDADETEIEIIDALLDTLDNPPQ